LPSSAWCDREQNKFIFTFICPERQAELGNEKNVGWATLFCPPFANKRGGQKNAAHPT